MKPLTEDENRILAIMLHENKIPSEAYEITEEHLIAFMHTYVHGFNRNSFALKTSEYRYARKLAGLSLLKHNVLLGASVNEIKAGMVYVIENEVFPWHYKIGMTVDLDSRINSYQTYDPFKRFKVKHYEFVLDRRHTEEQILKSFRLDLESGEWVKKKNCINVFRSITFKYKKVLA